MSEFYSMDYELDTDEISKIRGLEEGSIQDEAIEFLQTQKGRLPRIAGDLGIGQNTLYDIVAGRRTSLKAVTAEKILRYKLLLGQSLVSCQLRSLK